MSETKAEGSHGAGHGNEKKGLFSWFKFPKLKIIKKTLRAVNIPVKDRPDHGYTVSDMDIYDKLKDEINFKTIAELNTAMTDIERIWEGEAAEGHPSKAESAEGMWNEVVALYTGGLDDTKKLKEGLGPFTDLKVLNREIELTANGTGYDKRGYLNLEFLGKPITFEYHLPKEVTMTHMNGWEYPIAYFGRSNKTYWDVVLKKDIDDFLDRLRNIVENSSSSEDEKKRMNSWIDIYSSILADSMTTSENMIHDFEANHYSNIGGSAGVIAKVHTDYENIQKRVLGFRLSDDKVFYQHSYLITRSKVWDDNLKRTVNFGDAHPDWVMYEGEQGPGLDQNGWPLEVSDGDTKFKGKVIPRGEILIDHFNGKPIRKVKDEFIGECSLLDVATWIYCSYDGYRDDMRDGRYHPGSMSVMEYIGASLKIEDMESYSPEDYKKGKHAKVKIKLNKAKTGVHEEFRPNNDPGEVEQTIKPRHLNPAWDMRTRHNSIHLGRKLYYDIQDNLEQSNDPTITTRGAAMYILHRVIEQTKYWEGGSDHNKQGVVELLKAIGHQTGGFDIGPNLGTKFERWAKPLSKDPFNPSRSG